MKFITLFFLLAIILTVNVLVAESKGTYNRHSRKAVADTIIKLDTTKARDRKLLKVKKSKHNKPNLNADGQGVNSTYNITPAVDTVVKADTNKNKNIQAKPTIPGKPQTKLPETDTTKKDRRSVV